MAAAKVRKATIAQSTCDNLYLPALLPEQIRMSDNTRGTLHPQESIIVKSLFIFDNFSQLQDPQSRHGKKNNRCLKKFRDSLFSQIRSRIS
jgi:hypothetical protein